MFEVSPTGEAVESDAIWLRRVASSSLNALTSACKAALALVLVLVLLALVAGAFFVVVFVVAILFSF
tara:strand:- start:188 stop:388 length:201 start_codon:yes stop_codon:yes gene_type:complete